MKKNAMLKIAAILMVAVLLTTCAISSTFAKYTTNDVSSDSARVAKFGVEVTTDTLLDTLFLDEYGSRVINEGDATEETCATVESSGAISSISSLVAPGVAVNVDLNSTVSGSPEVAVKVSYQAQLNIEGDWTVDSSEYFPIVFYVGDSIFGLTGYTDKDGNKITSTYTSIAALKTAVETAINSYEMEFAPNEDLATATAAQNINIGWSWAFTPAADSANTDVKDTALGDKATLPTIQLVITTTVDQLN